MRVKRSSCTTTRSRPQSSESVSPFTELILVMELHVLSRVQAVFVAAASLLALSTGHAASAQGQSCPTNCAPDPQTVANGTVPIGVEWEFNFEGTPTPGTAAILFDPEYSVLFCATCTPCRATLKLEFGSGETGATACYSTSGGLGWWGYPEGSRDTDLTTNCDGDPQLILVQLHIWAAACGGGGAALGASATLNCNCLGS